MLWSRFMAKKPVENETMKFSGRELLIGLNDEINTGKDFNIEIQSETTIFYVEVMEYENGWGTRLDDNYFFTNYDDAKKFINLYNMENKKNNTNDWGLYISNEILMVSAGKLNTEKVLILQFKKD